jgi:hypothetical protein
VVPESNRFTDRNWRNLLMDIEARQVIPIIGPELLVLSQETGHPTLYQYLAKELVARLSLDQERLPPGYGLLDVTSLFLQDPRNRADELHYETRAILAARAWLTPEPLSQLATITHFDLFVSTTFDSLLEQALNEANLPGSAPSCILAYSERRQLEDLPADSGTAPRRIVYQLFGKLDGTGDYGLTEEKILEFAHRLQSRDQRPPNLFDALRARKLLALGCTLPGWLARFFLRASKGDQLLTQASGGVVADRTTRGDKPFVMFLERRQTAIYTDGDAVQFVAELHRRWTEGHGQEAPAQSVSAAPQGPDFKPDSVFISYASEDREYALKVKQAFDEAGVDVWFDQTNLVSGDLYKRKIDENIWNCSCFVPLISQNTETWDGDPRYFRTEWRKAIDRERYFGSTYPFIRPILLDNTPLPYEFLDRHARKLEALPQLIEDAKKQMRERRLKRRSA